MRIEIDIPQYTREELIKRALPRFDVFSANGKQDVYKILTHEISHLVHDWLGLPAPADDAQLVQVLDPTAPVKLYCSECDKRVPVRRMWDCTLSAYTGRCVIDDNYFFPIEASDIEIDEARGAEKDFSYYCAKCGKTLALNDEDLKKLLEERAEAEEFYADYIQDNAALESLPRVCWDYVCDHPEVVYRTYLEQRSSLECADEWKITEAAIREVLRANNIDTGEW